MPRYRRGKRVDHGLDAFDGPGLDLALLALGSRTEPARQGLVAIRPS